MSELERCSHCAGKKQVAPLGGILKDCTHCDAVGFVSVKDHAVNSMSGQCADSAIVAACDTATKARQERYKIQRKTAVNQSDHIKRKRGRPKVNL